MSVFTKICYGFGDVGGQLIWIFTSTYLTVFYTDIIGFTPITVSIIILIARIFDMAIDPLNGAIIERTRSRFGRFRPWILFGTPLLAIVNVMVFTLPGTVANQTIRFLLAGTSYIILDIVYSAVILSYGALSTAMTNNPSEIVQLNSARMIGSNLGAVLLNAISMPLLLYFSKGVTPTGFGYTMTVIIFSLLSLPLFYILFFFSKEVIHPPQNVQKVSIRKSFQVVLKNKPLMILMFIIIFYLGGIFGRLGVILYYYMYVLKRLDLVSLFMVLPTLCTAIMILITAKIVDRVGRKKMCTISFLGAALTLIGFYFTDINNIPVLVILTALYGAFCFSSPIPMAMIADAIDYGEDMTGIRADGTSFAVASLSIKISSAVGGSVGIILMGVFGYVANREQTSQAVHGINFVANILPAICFLLALIPLYFYPLTLEKVTDIRTRLRSRR